MAAKSMAVPPELMGNVERYAVYRCFSDQGELLYIGETGDLGKRFADHAKKLWFVQVRGSGGGGLMGGKISGIHLWPRVATPGSAPPPGSGAPLGRGVWPRPTGAGPTGARDFTTTEREFRRAD